MRGNQTQSCVPFPPVNLVLPVVTLNPLGRSYRHGTQVLRVVPPTRLRRPLTLWGPSASHWGVYRRQTCLVILSERPVLEPDRTVREFTIRRKLFHTYSGTCRDPAFSSIGTLDIGSLWFGNSSVFGDYHEPFRLFSARPARWK